MITDKLKDRLHKRHYPDGLTVVAAAGFEDRIMALPAVLSGSKARIQHAIILDYPNQKLNEPLRTKFISALSKIAGSVELIRILPDWTINKWKPPKPGTPVIVDVTGMNRAVMFEALAALHDTGETPDVAYTEAEQYYPLKRAYDLLTKDCAPEKAFSRYLREEKKHFAYSYDSRLGISRRFAGRPEPGKPFMLIGFFAFKRSRLQTVLQSLELEKKVFILGEPVRSDLKWRTHCMEIANWDLLMKNIDSVQPLTTLDPFEVYNYLESATYENNDYARYNIMVAPLGSKMQTLGCYLFVRRHAEVTVLFSHPRAFFPKRFSTGYRETFFIDGKKFMALPIRNNKEPPP
jgi:hypothetical protein